MGDALFKGESLLKLYECWLKSDEFHGLNPRLSDTDYDVAFIEWVMWLNGVPFVPHNIIKSNYRRVVIDNKDWSSLRCIKEILDKEVAK